jgi:hypothetical protein
MSDWQPSDAPAAIDQDPTQVSHRRRDKVDEPARALGPKRAALHARRVRAAPTCMAAPQGTCLLACKDASVAFALRPTHAGLLIERTQCQPMGARLVQTLLFETVNRFERWCDAEPTRFDEPMLYEQLRREGHEAFGSER